MAEVQESREGRTPNLAVHLGRARHGRWCGLPRKGPGWGSRGQGRWGLGRGDCPTCGGSSKYKYISLPGAGEWWEGVAALLPSALGVLEQGKRTSKVPPGNPPSPLLFLAPFSWSRRVSVVMQMRRCWRCWPTPILSPSQPSSALPSPRPALTSDWNIGQASLGPLPSAESAWRGRVTLRVLGASASATRIGKLP